jgi:formamidopyrimidine-DNA glycosylase
MPELPEVETTRRGIEPHLLGQTVRRIIIRDRRLRWPIPSNLPQALRGQKITRVARRGKYLLLYAEHGCLIVHLGMSGSLRILPADTPAQKHDHVDIQLENHACLRLRDPRRFGCMLWTRGDPMQHELLRALGIEPLSEKFSGRYLFETSRKRKVTIKSFIMNSHVVVGVGNIYANEALFAAGIHPARMAGRISQPRYARLVAAIQDVLHRAITAGGTTLRDFIASDGQPGYFRMELHVYGREGEPCVRCGAAIRHKVIGQRSTFYCPHCQH